MESTGQPGRVQVSATTAALLRDAGVHTLEYRGKVSAKGKGELDTYWLLNRHTGTPYRAPLPDRRSSGISGISGSGGFGIGRRASGLSVSRTSAFSIGRSSAASSVSDHAEQLSSIAVEGPGSREGSQRDGGGSYRSANPLYEEGGSVRRAFTAPQGTMQLAEDEEPQS